MTAKRISPACLYESTSFGFSHGALDEATGTLHLAGQARSTSGVPWVLMCR